MNDKENELNQYITKIRNRVPKNLKVFPVPKREIENINSYLKSRQGLNFSFGKLEDHFGENWNYDSHPLGYVMQNKVNDKIVGFLGTIYSRRNRSKKNKVCCHLLHWFVEKEFRIFSYALLLPLLEKKDIIINTTTPVQTIIPLYKRLGFDIKEMKYTIGFGFNLLSMLSKNYKRFFLSFDLNDIYNNLEDDQKQIFNDHKKFNCRHFIIKDKTNEMRPVYFITKRVMRHSLEVLDVIYISNHSVLSMYTKEIFTKICLSNKIFLIGMRCFDGMKINFTSYFLSKTVNKVFPILNARENKINNVLYSDYILFDI